MSFCNLRRESNTTSGPGLGAEINVEPLGFLDDLESLRACGLKGSELVGPSSGDVFRGRNIVGVGGTLRFPITCSGDIGIGNGGG